MTPAGEVTEGQIVEETTIALFPGMGWDTKNAFAEALGPTGTLGRDNQSEVVLVRSLREALERLNPLLPSDAVTKAVEELTKDRSAVHHVRANAELHKLIRDGVRVV